MAWRRPGKQHALWIGIGVGVIAATLAARSIATDLSTPRDQARSTYVGSDACRSCHPQHHESWHRTFHRSMTQQASARTVVGDFNNARLEYGGIEARMTRQDGAYAIQFSRGGGSQRWQATVERTIGSHRIQQYLARDKDMYFRLPVAWDVEAQQWIHMNGAFLTPDPTLQSTGTDGTRAIDRNDYDRHVTRWNDNCVFCHNVAPNPGLARDGHFDTTTAELGVACEACHGPGSEHARINRDPLRRYALHLSDRPDPSVANPQRMDEVRSAQVCGRCHGQRKATDIDRVLREGDTFVPGTDLSRHSTPLTRDTTLNGEHGHFAARFWNDGTPRLTAYEYQGVLLSPCNRSDELDCSSCHAMHDSDPNMQLRPDRDHRTRCTQCHTDLASDDRASAHSHHAIGSSGNQCQSCHMPRIAYGVMGARISHRIEIPDPARNTIDRRPDACTLCHVTQTRQWARDAMAAWKGSQHSPQEAGTNANAIGASDALPALATQLFAGDPIERAVAAEALGRHDTDRSARSRRYAWLLNALSQDPYPAVRHIARRSLLRLVNASDAGTIAAIKAFHVTELSIDPRQRAADAIAIMLDNPHDPTLDDRTIETLRHAAADRAIEIGE